MIGVGMFTMFLGYCILYWGVNAIQSKDQASFVQYLLPFAR